MQTIHSKMAALASLLALSAFTMSASVAATPYVNATVEGALAPGVYGQINIGNAPPPPLIYAQPIIVQRPAVLVQQPPLYLHVPPGHAKKWSKHCARYNACGVPVYFVRVDGDEDFERRQYQRVYAEQHGYKDKHEDKHWDKHKDKEYKHGKKHGKDHDD